MKSIKQLFLTALVITGLINALLVFSLWRVGVAADALTQAQQARYVSASLADELRQSSDDLTRLARTYVMTGDPMWEQQYFEVLDIRNGKKPRPDGYEKIYWDWRGAPGGLWQGQGRALAGEHETGGLHRGRVCQAQGGRC
jgi:methyl-accepting chemotaxis protein